ncbi:MAG: protein-disulfide reductase DsbD domain-containing protein [Phycisphaerae bacterium]
MLPYRKHLAVLTILTLSAWVATPPAAGAPDQPAGNAYVSVELVTATDDFTKPFEVGLHFEMADGWHIYWKNPGEAGIPPKVTWNLPDGFTVTDLQYPIPSTYILGGIETFGYSKSALLTATVTPPDGYEPAAGDAISADVDYLVCEAICLRAAASVSVPLTPEAARPGLFEQTSGAFPVAATDSAFVANVSTSSRGDRHTIDMTWRGPVADVAFYPATTNALGVEDVTVKAGDRRTTVTFTTKAYGEVPASLETVLTFKDDKGQRHGVVVPVKTQGS